MADPHFDFGPTEKRKRFSWDLAELHGQVDCVAIAGDVSSDPYSADEFFGLFDQYKCVKLAVEGNHEKWYGPSAKMTYPASTRMNRSFHGLARKHGFIVPAPSKPYEFIKTRIGRVLLFNITYRPDLPDEDQQTTCDNQYFDVYKYARRLELPEPQPEPPVLAMSHQVPHSSIPTRFEHDNPMFITPDINVVLRASNASLCLFGHSHEPVDVIQDGVRYINQPIGYVVPPIGYLKTMVIDTEKPHKTIYPRGAPIPEGVDAEEKGWYD